METTKTLVLDAPLFTKCAMWRCYYAHTVGYTIDLDPQTSHVSLFITAIHGPVSSENSSRVCEGKGQAGFQVYFTPCTPAQVVSWIPTDYTSAQVDVGRKGNMCKVPKCQIPIRMMRALNVLAKQMQQTNKSVRRQSAHTHTVVRS